MWGWGGVGGKRGERERGTDGGGEGVRNGGEIV